MLSYRDALTYVYSFTDYEKRGFAVYAPEFYDLDRVRRLLVLLGKPQRSFQAIHIAGTKGKGSTAAMVESVLRTAGYRTGLYTSPHLHTFRERIQTCGDLIPEADVTRLVEEMKPLVAQVADVTTFEIMTVLAFVWFAEQGVEWAVAEVGLGGRLDATNVLTPAVAVITSISYDHTAILGESLAQIAAEKAGIVKPGVPVVSAPQPAEAQFVIEERCSQLGAPLTVVGRDWRWELTAADLEGQSFALVKGQRVMEDLWIPLLGEHQVVNAATAVAALSLLGRSGIDLPQTAIRDGLRAVHWPGRLEILGQAPLVVVDSAHNGDSAQKLVAALRDCCGRRRLVVVLGASADHATPELMAALLSGADRAIATRTRHPRAADPSWLQAQAAELGFCLEVRETVAQALTAAMDDAGPEDLVCCTGSVFVAAEAREAWFARQGLALPPSDPA
ncbi:MAG: bifunctional folylpolyglutamate synthase/dihydrofolate synthase [Anaerolineae bacterium]